MLVNDLYIIKRAVFPKFTEDDTEDIDYDEWYDHDYDDVLIDIDFPIEPIVELDEEDANPMVEAGVFIDQVAYKRLAQVRRALKTKAPLRV